ncbi:unnamed protein product [Pleuronectes platessa]|uniref:Uncharacterized protein n=1 Tax=Pleuronectes platessa TaxID=8262 RepID=A0A9N7TM87_PLEPL|nr:unnamed protein product [Pleuronectes platessa]
MEQGSRRTGSTAGFQLGCRPVRSNEPLHASTPARRVCASSFVYVEGSGVEEAQVHLQDVLQPEEPSDMLKKKQVSRPSGGMTSSSQDDSLTVLRLVSNFSASVFNPQDTAGRPVMEDMILSHTLTY